MEKKTKLTISGSTKKSIENIEIAKTQSKNSVVIQKKTSKYFSKSPFNKGSSSQRPKNNSSFIQKSTNIKKNFPSFSN